MTTIVATGEISEKWMIEVDVQKGSISSTNPKSIRLRSRKIYLYIYIYIYTKEEKGI